MKKNLCVLNARFIVVFCVFIFLLPFTVFAKWGQCPNEIKVERLNNPKMVRDTSYPFGVTTSGTYNFRPIVYPGDQLKITVGYSDPAAYNNCYFGIFGWYLSISSFGEIFDLSVNPYSPMSTPQTIYYTVPPQPDVAYTFSIFADIAFPVGISSAYPNLGKYIYKVNFTVKPTSSRPTGPSFPDSIHSKPYPNPAFNTLNVEIGGTNAPVSVELYDDQGTLQRSQSSTAGTTQMDVSTLKRGRYILRVKGSQGQIDSKHVLLK